MARTKNGNGKHGSKWISREKRLEIYRRDGFGCVYCARGIEDGVMLTLDHIIPRSQGGKNIAMNLVTACGPCNSARKDRPANEFIEAVANYIVVDAQAIADHIAETIKRPLDLAVSRAFIAARGSYAEALNAHRDMLREV